MLNQQSTIFPKQLKLDDYQPNTEQNIIRIMQTSNLLLGNGGRSSNASIIMIKCLHMLQEECVIDLKGKWMLEFGCGVGLLGIYMGAIGVNVVLTDLPAIKDMAERNINLNRDIIKGQTQFAVLNWKKTPKQSGQIQKQQGKSTSSSDISTTKSLQKIQWTLACQCGNLQDLACQLKWIGKHGMFLGFMQREGEDFMNCRDLQRYLLDNEYQYQKIESYHPDYVDERVAIYRIWK